jgi:hypothetical protein
MGSLPRRPGQLEQPKSMGIVDRLCKKPVVKLSGTEGGRSVRYKDQGEYHQPPEQLLDFRRAITTFLLILRSIPLLRPSLNVSSRNNALRCPSSWRSMFLLWN